MSRDTSTIMLQSEERDRKQDRAKRRVSWVPSELTPMNEEKAQKAREEAARAKKEQHNNLPPAWTMTKVHKPLPPPILFELHPSTLYAPGDADGPDALRAPGRGETVCVALRFANHAIVFFGSVQKDISGSNASGKPELSMVCYLVTLWSFLYPPHAILGKQQPRKLALLTVKALVVNYSQRPFDQYERAMQHFDGHDSSLIVVFLVLVTL